MITRLTLLILGLFQMATGAWIILAPMSWYAAVPTVAATASFNPHFIAHTRLAFVSSGAGLAEFSFPVPSGMRAHHHDQRFTQSRKARADRACAHAGAGGILVGLTIGCLQKADVGDHALAGHFDDLRNDIVSFFKGSRQAR